MRIATIDFTKAFDSITHKSIWKALNSCGINHEYFSLLKKIYKDQKASVHMDVESNMFEIKKGTKQGDSLSSLLLRTAGAAATAARRTPGHAPRTKCSSQPGRYEVAGPVGGGEYGSERRTARVGELGHILQGTSLA